MQHWLRPESFGAHATRSPSRGRLRITGARPIQSLRPHGIERSSWPRLQAGDAFVQIEQEGDAFGVGGVGLFAAAGLVRRAFEGTDEPVYYKGEECGSVRKYSDTLAIFLLKAHAPEKYRENIHAELTGAGGGPIALQAAVHVLTDDELARIAGSGST